MFWGASVPDQVVGVGLLKSPLDWIVGVGFLAWVFHRCTGIPGYLAQAPWTTPGHPGQQSGDTSCTGQNLSLKTSHLSYYIPRILA